MSGAELHSHADLKLLGTLDVVETEKSMVAVAPPTVRHRSS
jgi:hypothetical protein